MDMCPTTLIKIGFAPGYAKKNTADLTKDDVLWVAPTKKKAKKATKKKVKK